MDVWLCYSSLILSRNVFHEGPEWEAKHFNMLHAFLFMQASRLSTLSLQHDKRMDDESKGGKRKIRVVQDRVTDFIFDWATPVFHIYSALY